MTDDEAIRRYDAAGRTAGRAPGAVRWPDLALERENLERLAEGLFGARLDLACEAFGQDFDSAAAAARLEESWRTEALEARFAPEGVLVRVRFTVRVTLTADEDEPPVREGGTEPASEETLTLAGEFGLSFVERFHVRPFVDFLGGEVRRTGDGAARRLEAFAAMITPQEAVAWGLNGAAEDG